MESAVSALSSTITAASLWGVFTDALPFLAIVVVVSFGFYLIRRMIKGLAKGKARI